MGLYNTLLVTTNCPRCSVEAEMEAEFRFGLMDLSRYRIGDHLRWDGKGVRAPSTRPENGDYDGEAYVVCSHCERDFWLTISVRNDVIASTVVDTTRQPYLPDETAQHDQVQSFELTQERKSSGKDIKVRFNRYNLEEVESIWAEVTRVAEGMLNGGTGVIEGARTIVALGYKVDPFQNDADFLTFTAISSETDHLPVGEERKFWAESALKQKDIEIRRLENHYREQAYAACRSLLEKQKNYR